LIQFQFTNKSGPFKVLCLGAHSDDIEIGCGATVLKIASTTEAVFRWEVFSSESLRKEEALCSANLFLESANSKQIYTHDFRNGYFPYIGGEIKDHFERIKVEFSPDLILTHFRGDLHQDHRLISDLTWNTYRNHLILEYEIPKYDGDLGSPNVFVQLDEGLCRKKIAYIKQCFASQKEKHWFSEDLFLSLMRLRGMESAITKYAEAFYCRKILF
jgi:LmbE family N-acetylglucosaminyl deacetylase